MTKEKLEIYKQRYETFRHLDKLRWQMLQIAVATASVILTFGANGSTNSKWWTWTVTGMILLILGFAMARIGSGIKRNGKALCNIGKLVGDINIPKQSSNYKSVSFWIAIIMMVAGLACLVLSLSLKYAV